MAIEGELNGLHPSVKCSECGTDLPLSVCHSMAGYYLGYECHTCGPYSRETDYFRTEDEAAYAFLLWRDLNVEPKNIRDTRYHG